MNFSTLLMVLILSSCASKSSDKKITTAPLPTETQPELQTVTEFRGVQITGVTVSNSGRLFANVPRWRENIPYSVVEITPEGNHIPYPNEAWNKWRGRPEKNKFTCVQSVVAVGNSLFVLDPSSPKMEAVVGNAKLYEFSLNTNELIRTYTFDRTVAPKKSYLNDLRVDEVNNKIYITDSGLGGIVVLDRESGQARRVLDSHASTKSENVTLLVNGKAFMMRGRAPKIHSDGIALSNDRLYYHALTGYHLYSVPTEALTDASLSASDLASKVENRGVTPAPDGMIFDQSGNLYMADLERNAVAYRTPGGDMKILIQDERIQWPDTFTIDGENNLIFSDSALQRSPAGQDIMGQIFTIYKVALP